MKTSELMTVAALLRDAGRADIMPRFRRLEAGAVKVKTGPLDLVTAADEAAEIRITEGLRREFPGCEGRTARSRPIARRSRRARPSLHRRGSGVLVAC